MSSTPRVGGSRDDHCSSRFPRLPCRNRSHDVPPLSPRLVEGEGDRCTGDVQASATPTEARRPCQVRYGQLAAAPVRETGLAPPSNLVCHGMLYSSWAARCHAHAHAIMLAGHEVTRYRR